MKIKRFFKKVIDFCTSSPFETENDILYSDLNARIQEIKETNSKILIKKIIMPKIQKQFYHDTNMLMPDNQALEMAVKFFIIAKEHGRIDELNNIVESEVK